MKKKKMLGMVVFFMVAVAAPGSITNIQKIEELSQSGTYEQAPTTTSDELRIVFARFTVLPGLSFSLYEATRNNVSEPFGSPSSSPFVNVVSPGLPMPMPSWLSDDGLRLYLQAFASGEENVDIYYTTRTTVLEPFFAPTKLANINDENTYDINAVLANGERSLYFSSNREAFPAYRIYRAARSTPAETFGAPVMLAELGENSIVLDVREDELAILLTNSWGDLISMAERGSTSQPFSAPVLIHQFFSPTSLNSGSATADFTRLYFSLVTETGGFPSEIDLYVADLSNAPLPPPTASPTPTPVPPLPPLPPIELIADPTQLLAGGTRKINPYGGAFDTQGRFIFFDQYRSYGSGTLGNNRLMRLTSGSPPTVEVLATQEQLAAVDSQWSNPSYPCLLTDLVVLSNDAVVFSYHSFGVSQPKIIRVTPGSPPQIALVATINLSGYTNVSLAPDRGVSPNTLYVCPGGLSGNTSILSIAADSTNGTLETWHTLSVENSSPPTAAFGPPQLLVDRTGDVIIAPGGVDNLIRIEKTTKTETTIVPGGINPAVLSRYRAARGLALDPRNGTIFILAYAEVDSPYPGTHSVNNLIRLAANGDGTYQATDYMVEEQLRENADISALDPSRVMRLMTFANSIAIHPSHPILYTASGSNDYYLYTPGYHAVIGIGTEPALHARPQMWRNYR